VGLRGPYVTLMDEDHCSSRGSVCDWVFSQVLVSCSEVADKLVLSTCTAEVLGTDQDPGCNEQILVVCISGVL